MHEWKYGIGKKADMMAKCDSGGVSFVYYLHHLVSLLINRSCKDRQLDRPLYTRSTKSCSVASLKLITTKSFTNFHINQRTYIISECIYQVEGMCQRVTTSFPIENLFIRNECHLVLKCRNQQLNWGKRFPRYTMYLDSFSL